MDALNHADQMRLANLINDNSDDAEIQKKLDQVVELTSSTRDQAAVALHDCHYDVEKAVDMILEGDQAIVENQWKSAGKKKNKNSQQTAKSGTHSAGYVGGSNKSTGPSSNRAHHAATSVSHNSQGGQSNNRSAVPTIGDSSTIAARDFSSRGNLSSSAQQTNTSNISSGQSNKHDASDGLKNIAGTSSSNLINSSDLATTTSSNTAAAATTNKASSMQHQHQQPQHLHQHKHQQPRQKGTMQIGSRQHHQRTTRIPESAVEMPNNELQVSSLNVQFGELDIKDATAGASEGKGAFQDVLETNRLGRQAGLPNSHSSHQDSRGNRQGPQQYVSRGGPRRPYNERDDRKIYGNSSRGGRQISGNQRQYNQRGGPLGQSSARGGGVRTILNRGLQTGSNLASSTSAQQSGGFPNSIDTWTNSTAEAATKLSHDQAISGVGNTLRVGQWSDVAGNEDWSEEEHWDAKVMETKVFTPSSKSVDGPVVGQKSQLLTDTTAPSQINLASKLSESSRDDVGPQASTLNSAQPGQQQPSQKQLSHMNDIFDPSLAKAVLEQQNLAAMKSKTSIGIGQYNKETSEAKTVLDPQNLSSIKPKSSIATMNQYNKEASESLKSLVGISTGGANSGSTNNNTKGGITSVPPGALPLMSQPQYIMGNAYPQPAIFPYAYQAPDVHYPVAAPTTGRDQNFQSVYPPNDGNKFSRGTDGDAPSIATTQTAPVASQTHNQFVANALHAGYQLTYAMPGAFNMMPQNLYSAPPIFPHIPQPTNTQSASTVYQKSTPASYQHHTGYSGYDQLNPLIQDYVNKQQNYSGSNMLQQQQPTSKSSGVSSDLDVATGANSYNMYVGKGQTQQSKQTNYNDVKGYQQQMSNNGPQQQFGFPHNSQQPTSLAGGYPLLPHNLDNTELGGQTGSAQSQLHSANQRSGGPASKYYNNWS